LQAFAIFCFTEVFVYVTTGFLLFAFLTLFCLTVILHFSFLFPTFAVIVALPAFLPLTFPLLLTVATFLLEDDHLTFFLLPFTLSLTVFPT